MLLLLQLFVLMQPDIDLLLERVLPDSSRGAFELRGGLELALAGEPVFDLSSQNSDGPKMALGWPQEPAWSHPSAILNACGSNPGATLRPFWGQPGAILGPSWDHLGIILGPSWGHLGAILGPSWCYLGTILGLPWGHPGAILGPSWDHHEPSTALHTACPATFFFLQGPQEQTTVLLRSQPSCRWHAR